MPDDPIDPDTVDLDLDVLDGDGGDACSCACSFGDDDRGVLDRRRLVEVLATIGGLTAVGSLAAPLASLTKVFERKYTGPIYSDGVHLVDDEGERIGTDRLGEGEVLTVFPESHPGVESAPTLLVRLAPDDYAESMRSATVEGYAAFSKVCTHAGCMVSDVEDTTFVCPCHFGKFDPTRSAAVVGGPPPRPLPLLPLATDEEGALVSTGDFQGHIGPGEG
ncbi:MAG: ubiquinol-cytochrome c reductase iron-sulfur subunit [Haloarculaceae archaeon]